MVLLDWNHFVFQVLNLRKKQLEHSRMALPSLPPAVPWLGIPTAELADGFCLQPTGTIPIPIRRKPSRELSCTLEMPISLY